MEFEEYPKMLYKLGDVKNAKTVANEAEEEALGDDWIDGIIDPDSMTDMPSA